MFYFQDLSLNVHSYLNLSLHGSSSLFDNHWLYQRNNEIFTLKSASFLWCRLNLNGTEWLVEIDWKNFENDRKSFGTVLNTLRATPQNGQTHSNNLSHPSQEEITHSPRRHFLENCFPQQQKEVEETTICFIKIQSENTEKTWNIRLFLFCTICNFFDCDGFTVLLIISIIQYGLILLLPLLCNHNNLILKLHQKKITTLMKNGKVWGLDK